MADHLRPATPSTGAPDWAAHVPRAEHTDQPRLNDPVSMLRHNRPWLHRGNGFRTRMAASNKSLGHPAARPARALCRIETVLQWAVKAFVKWCAKQKPDPNFRTPRTNGRGAQRQTCRKIGRAEPKNWDANAGFLLWPVPNFGAFIHLSKMGHKKFLGDHGDPL